MAGKLRRCVCPLLFTLAFTASFASAFLFLSLLPVLSSQHHSKLHFLNRRIREAEENEGADEHTLQQLKRQRTQLLARLGISGSGSASGSAKGKERTTEKVTADSVQNADKDDDVRTSSLSSAAERSSEPSSSREHTESGNDSDSNNKPPKRRLRKE